MASSKSKDTGSSLKALIIGLLLIVAVAGGIYILSQSNIFDTSGGYIKGMADEGDVVGFMKRAKAISYYDLISGEAKDFKDVAIKYYGEIVSKEVSNDKTATYQITILCNAKDSQKLGNTYKKNKNNEAIVPIIAHAPEGYSNFTIGDDVYVYGLLKDYKKTDKYEKVPYLELKKVSLDDETYKIRDSKE